MNRSAILLFVALITITAASPAAAQWTRVTELPSTDIFNVWTKGDTIGAGGDSIAYVSVNAGATWKTTSLVASGAVQVSAVRIHGGRLYAATLRQGVFVSDDLGTTWQSFNQGLVGGFANSQLDIADLLVQGDSMYAATQGSGAWIRNLRAGTWSKYGNALEPAQASNMEGIASSGTRLLASAGFNGDVYYRDPTDTDWNFEYLEGHVAAGLAALAAHWTGRAWLVGSNIGVFRSATGVEPWVYTDFGLHPTLFASFAQRGDVTFTHFASGEGTGIEFSTDDGVSWHVLDAQAGIFTYNIATLGNVLYAGRLDGLWRRPIDTVGVPDAPVAAGLHFRNAGANPVLDEALLHFDLATATRVRVQLFDVAGRLAPGGIDEVRPAGRNEVRLGLDSLAPGLYVARLVVDGRTESVKLVRSR